MGRLLLSAGLPGGLFSIMCGFIGQITRADTKKDELLRGLTQLLRRGPDSQQLWLSADNAVRLFHARLAIVDKDPKANQPFSNREAGVTVAFIGEVYNYQELKSKFPQYPFCTKSDTEVILAAYLEHGIRGLALLKGQFSLVIVDEKRKKVILARDPIGKKPLFIGWWKDNLLFGSSIFALLAVHKKEVNLNRQVLDYFWEHAFIPPNTSVISEIKPVLPGEAMEFDWGGNLLSQTRLEPDRLYSYNGESPDKVDEIISSLFEIAVRRRLVNNPKPTVLLSGGIDSTLVCQVMNNICLKESQTIKPQAITLRSFFPMGNDEFYARFAAARIKIPLKLVKPAMRHPEDSIIKALDLQDEPLGMISFYLLERLVSAAADYGRILFSGDGADEMFLGYGKPSDWYGSQQREGFKQTNGMFECGPCITAWMSKWGRQTVTQTLVGHMFTKADRASAEQGVELRCPFLDWDLVSYVRSLPFKILTNGNRPKALLKNQLSGWPRWFLERPKLGFAYNLRWHWGLSRYAGLREAIEQRSVDSFESYLPKILRRNPLNWKTVDIFKNFVTIWRLLAWSRFLARLDDIGEK